MPLPECVGEKCHELTFETSDLQTETYQINGDLDAMGRQRVYPWPEDGDPLLNVGLLPQALAQFTQEGEQEMDNIPAVIPGTCPGSCTCIPSTDAKDITSVPSRVPVSSTTAFPDGSGTMTVTGSFQLDTTRTEGLCTIGSRSNLKVSLVVPEKIKEKLISAGEAEEQNTKPEKQTVEKY